MQAYGDLSNLLSMVDSTYRRLFLYGHREPHIRKCACFVAGSEPASELHCSMTALHSGMLVEISLCRNDWLSATYSLAARDKLLAP